MEEAMAAAQRLALRHGVAIGAHPGFPSRGDFGRREQPVTPDEAKDSMHKSQRTGEET
jgi:UPF0271 protein